MPKFDYFVIFAEMRTGSNFLESNLSQFEELALHGEAFNPHFIGRPNRKEICGITRDQRDADPAGLLDRLMAADDRLPGFRYFHDHEPRILDRMLADPRCGKVVLTRNPLESYVSVKLAKKTKQWMLTDMADAKTATVTFDLAEFEAHLDRLQAFQLRILHGCQVAGQAPFYINYADINDVPVLNGLAEFLGARTRIEALERALKPQNPAPLHEKVANFDQMMADLPRLDTFDLNRTPQFEPRRAPAVPSYFAAARVPLMFLPINGGPVERICAWMAALEDEPVADALLSGFNQKTLRQWRRDHPGHRSFAVLRHPVARAHDVFCRRILATGDAAYGQLRKQLRRRYELPVPEGAVGPDWDATRHAAAFDVFLRFVAGNLSGQTEIRVDSGWATQAAVLQGMQDVALPDRLIREETLEDELAALAQTVGVEAGAPPPPDDPSPIPLSAIYSEQLEDRVRRIYQKDYQTFGFADWR